MQREVPASSAVGSIWQTVNSPPPDLFLRTQVIAAQNLSAAME
jgi:hypothetical protein